MSPERQCDCLVVGAGPAGSAAAIEMARAGLDVVVIDRGEFPRFRIGESLLPRTQQAFRRLGLLDRCLALPHAPKVGVEIVMGDGRYGSRFFFFRDVLHGQERDTFNMARVHLDEMLMKVAVEAGAEVRTSCSLSGIQHREDGRVEVDTQKGPVRARWMLDASGQSTALGRDFGTRRFHSELRNVAYFEHYEHVVRGQGAAANCAAIVVAEEGWFWIIPLDATKTSIGFVAREALHRALDVPASERLWWAIDRTPVMAERMANAVGPRESRTIADFTYRCDPFTGPGFLLVGDAAAFLDPVWSTGVTLGLLGAEKASGAVIRMCGGSSPVKERERYAAWTDRITRRAFRLVEGFYEDGFRDLLFAPKRPRDLERALVTLLAGEFIDVPIGTAVRCQALASMCALQHRWKFAPRVRPFSLRHHITARAPQAVGSAAEEGGA